MEAYNEAEIGAFVGPNLFPGAYSAQASTCFRISIGEVVSLQIFRHDPFERIFKMQLGKVNLSFISLQVHLVFLPWPNQSSKLWYVDDVYFT